jgi:hypothetical protein
MGFFLIETRPMHSIYSNFDYDFKVSIPDGVEIETYDINNVREFVMDQIEERRIAVSVGGL